MSFLLVAVFTTLSIFATRSRIPYLPRGSDTPVPFSTRKLVRDVRDALQNDNFRNLFWLMLTLVFEFSFGLARGLDWSQMLAAYTFKDGNLWPLCLLITLTAPWLVGWYRGWFN